MQTFKPNKDTILLTKACAWLCAALSLLFIIGLFLNLSEAISGNFDKSYRQIFTDIGVSLFVVSITTAGAWYCFYYLRSFPFMSVTIDDDGIWPAHLSKETELIHWQDVSNIQARSLMQCLDLKNREGVTLIKLEYKLAEFDKLHSILEKNTEIYTRQPITPATFSKALSYHLFYAIGLIVFSILGWYAYKDSHHILVLLLIVVVIISFVYEYLERPVRVTVSKDNLIIKYPFISYTYSYSEITSVRICIKSRFAGPTTYYSDIESVRRDCAHPVANMQLIQVDIHVNDGRGKPHVLFKMGDMTMVYQQIHAAWKSE